MKHTFLKKWLVFQLILSMLVSYLPADAFGALSRSARAEAAPAASSFEDVLQRAQRQGAPVLSDGEWRYTIVEPEGYAVVTGHADPSASAITVPDRIGGADVAAIGAGVFQAHQNLQRIDLPGNVNALAADAVPAGVTIAGYNASYAQQFAAQHGYPFASRSAYDFCPGVVDYADIRQDAFIRHSAYSLTLRELEASRLRAGSLFFLVDPENAYQISYYRVKSISPAENGFVSLTCETPATDVIMRSFSGQNEKMMLDVSTLQLGEGVSMPARSRSARSLDKVELPLDITVPLKSINTKIIVQGKYEASFEMDYKGTEDSYKEATLDVTETTDLSVIVTFDEAISNQNAFKQDFEDYDELLKKLIAGQGAGADKLALDVQRIPLGIGYVFGYAGIASCQVQFMLEFELTGECTFTYQSTTVSTYYGNSEGEDQKKSVVKDKKTDLVGSIKGKAGVRGEVNVYLFCACVLQVSGFAGIEAELSSSLSDRVILGGNPLLAPDGINTLDCLEMKLNFIVEVKIAAGLLKVLNFDTPLYASVSPSFKLVDIPLLNMHLHTEPKTYLLELFTNKLTTGSDKDGWHYAAECPYGKVSLTLNLSTPLPGTKNPYLAFTHLDPGFTVPQPPDPCADTEEFRLTGWYQGDEEVTFPITLTDEDLTLTARIQRRQTIHFIYEDGTDVAAPLSLFPGETFTLPETDPEREIGRWTRVSDRFFRDYIEDVVPDENGLCAVNTVKGDLYLCAMEKADVTIELLMRIHNGPLISTGSVMIRAGRSFTPPENPASQLYESYGWRDFYGNVVTMPYDIPADASGTITLVHCLGEPPQEQPGFNWLSSLYPGNGMSSRSDGFLTAIREDESTGDEYVVITGWKEEYVDEDDNPHYNPAYNLTIPSFIDGKPVRVIGESAFRNIGSLLSIKLPGTLYTIESSAFAACENLGLVDMTDCLFLSSIGNSAFAFCPSLVEARFPKNISLSLEPLCFRDSGIVEATLNGQIGTNAFANCTSLQRVHITGSSCVDPGAFTGCTRLREVVMDEGVTSVGTNAFKNCTSLFSINFPSSITTVGSDVIRNCTALDTLIIGGDAPVRYTSTAPFAIGDASQLRVLVLGEGLTTLTDLSTTPMPLLTDLPLPDSLETIFPNALNGTNLTVLNLPDNLKSIGTSAVANSPYLTTVTWNGFDGTIDTYAFANCISLQKVHLSGVKTIPERAFENCLSLSDVVLDGVEIIDKYAFHNCGFEGLKLPETLLHIREGAFDSCANLRELRLPESLLSTGPSFIRDCTALEKLSINSQMDPLWISIGNANAMRHLEFGEGITRIDHSFARCGYDSVETLILPDSLESIRADAFTGLNITTVHLGRNLSYIGANAFASCPSLESVVWEGDNLVISSNAFNACTSLYSVSLKGVTSIGASAFAMCTALEDVTIEGRSATIGASAFAHTDALYSATLSGVTSIGELALDGSGVEIVRVADGLTQLGKGAFLGCRNLKTLLLPDTLTTMGLGIIEDCAALEHLRIGGVKKLQGLHEISYIDGSAPLPNMRVLEIGEGVESIATSQFTGMSHLTQLILPETLQTIGAYAFEGLSNLGCLVLPASLTTIGLSAFEESLFEEVVIKGSDMTVGRSAFTRCPALRRVTFTGENIALDISAFESCTSLESVCGDFRSTGYRTFYNCALKEVVLPDNMHTIGEYTFKDCTQLVSLVVPDSVTSIGDYFVSGCVNLQSLTLGGGVETVSNMMLSIGEDAQLRHLSIGEGVRVIEQYAITNPYRSTVGDGFTHLETVLLPDSLEEIGRYAFQKSTLTAVSGGSRLKKIAYGAFQKCEQLRQVSLEGSDLVIEDYAFSFCKSLTDLTLGSGVKSIGTDAFSGCGLQNVVLSEGLETVGGSAFSSNRSLTSLSFPDSVSSYGKSALSQCASLERLYLGGGIASDMQPLPHSSLSRLKVLEIGEGVASMDEGALNNVSSTSLEFVILPESLVTIGAKNLDRLYSLKKGVLLSSDMVSIGAPDGQINYPLYTKRYNQVVKDFADAVHTEYHVLDADTLPVCTLTFLSGTASGADGLVQIAQSESALFSGLSFPEVTAPDGYRFTGWYYDADCTRPAAQGDVITEQSMQLYAGFVPQDVIRFAVKLPANASMDGLVPDASLPEGYLLYASAAQAQTSAVLPDLPCLEGFSFTGWHLDPALISAYDQAASPFHPGVLYGGFVPASRGALYTQGENGLVISDFRLTESDGDSVILPSFADGQKVTGIADDAFSASGVREITLPATLEHVADRAFSNAFMLENIHVSADNPHFTARGGVLFSKDMTVLYRYPQGRGSTVYTVPDTVTAIAPRAFEGCRDLRTIRFPDGLRSISDHAFSRCTGLTGLDLPASVTHLGDGAFEGCLRISSVTACGLESMGEGALPANIAMAVRGPLLKGVLRDWCISLFGVNLNYNIRYLTVLLGGDTVTSLSVEAGQPLPAQAYLCYLGSDALTADLFKDAALTQRWDPDADVMPNEDLTLYTTSIPVFASEAITLDSGESGCILTAYHGKGGEVVLPESVSGLPVVAIGSGFLASARGTVHSLTIGPDVAAIFDGALDDAYGQPFAGTVFAAAGSYAAQWAEAAGLRVQTRTFSLSFHTMGGAALAGLQAAAGAAVRLPVPVRDGCVFDAWYLDAECTMAVPLDAGGLYTMPAGHTTLYAAWTQAEAIDLPFAWEETAQGVVITGYTGNAASAVLPDRINGVDVTGIGSSAFADCTALQTLTLPSGLRSIGDYAFARASSLTALVIPDSVESIGSGAFLDCSALTALHLGAGVTTLGANALRGLTALEALSGGSGVFSVQDGVLYTHNGQTLVCCPAGRTGSFSIPEGVAAVEAYAFEGCALTSVTLPSGLMQLGKGAFADCDQLAAFTADNGDEAMLAIPERCFAGCGSLSEVVLGETVYHVGTSAFINCTSLQTVHLAAGVESISATAFAGTHADLTLCGSRGSEAQRHALDNGYRFIAVDQPNAERLFFDEEAIELVLGRQQKLSVHILPEGAAADLRWRSADETVAAVTDGVVRALSRGETVITASAPNGTAAQIRVIVKGTPAESIALSAREIRVAPGSSHTLTITIQPAWADTACTWSSSHPEIASVDQNGTVTGHSAGAAIIRAETPGGCMAEASVTVFRPVESVTVNVGADGLTMNIIDSPSLQLETTILPADATYQTLSFVSGDEKVVTVSPDGLVAITGTGETAITISTIYTPDEPIVITLPVAVQPYDLSGLTLPDLDPILYQDTASYLYPELDLAIGGRALVKDQDYIIETEASTIGTHPYTVRGVGLFTGSVSGTFEIRRQQAVIEYTGKNIALVKGFSPQYTSNMSSSVQKAYARADAPDEWSQKVPTVAGDYLLRLSVESTPNVEGCEVIVPIQLVDSAIKRLWLSTEELHMLNTQTLTVLIDMELYEGLSLSFPSLSYTYDDSLLTLGRSAGSQWGYGTFGSFKITPRPGAEGQTVITITCSNLPGSVLQCTVNLSSEGTSFSLPGVTVVEDEAFEGTQANLMAFSQKELTLGSRAFAGSDQLWQVSAPASNVTAAADALAGTSAVLVCRQWSSTHTLARELGLPYAVQ